MIIDENGTDRITLADLTDNSYSFCDKDGKPDYHVNFPEGDYLLVVVGIDVSTAARNFDHENVLMVKKCIHSFKHYYRDGRKTWTHKPGIDMIFAIKKENIYVVRKRGYSYVPVEINGKIFHLNVMGGTFNGWTDSVTQCSSIGVCKTLKAPNTLAAMTFKPDDFTVDSVKPMGESEQEEYDELCAYYSAKDKICQGFKVYLKSCYNVQGSHEPLLVDKRPPRKRYFICTTGYKYSPMVRVYYKHIDWKQTADMNNITVQK